MACPLSGPVGDGALVIEKIKKALDALRYITVGVLDKVMEFNNSWEDPWDSQKKEK